jgi:hypothetical protein
MNKKGFTVVELIVSFSLTMIVVALLFQMLLSLKDLYISSGFKSQLLNKQALMSSKINNDLKNKKIIIALKCGDNCLNFFFDDNTNSKLIVDDKNNIFSYGDYTTKLVDGSKFGNTIVRNEKINGLDPNTNYDSFIEIKIPINHVLLKEDYGVNMIYQYDSRISSISDITFNTLGDVEYRVVLTGSQTHYFPSGTTYVEPGYTVLKADDGTINPAGYNVTVTGTVLNTVGAISTLTYTLRNPSNTIVDTRTRTVHAIQSVYNFTYTGASQQFIAPVNGVYRVELWGSSGGNIEGFGGYTKGEIQLIYDGVPFHIYVGQAGVAGTYGNNTTSTVGQGAAATFNGGGAGGNAGGGAYPYANYRGGASGGGATDLRTTSGTWNNTTSLRSRLMVAAAGGGTGGLVAGDVSYDSNRSHAGGLVGQLGAVQTYLAGTYEQHVPMRGVGATQTTGFGFGIGGTGANTGDPTYCNGHSGGGAGYYGGTGGQSTGGSCHMMGGGAGSSFISGHPGVNAINSDGTHSNQSNHFSGLVFSNTEMKSGNEVMPNPAGGTQTGHQGNGYARVTLISIINS